MLITCIGIEQIQLNDRGSSMVDRWAPELSTGASLQSSINHQPSMIRLISKTPKATPRLPGTTSTRCLLYLFPLCPLFAWT